MLEKLAILFIPLLQSVLQLFIMLLNPFFLIPLVIIFYKKYKKNKIYKESAYYKVTKIPYKIIKYDKGKLGEYLTYMNLKKFEDDGSKFLFNIYIPKENFETVEIDVLMISKKGIFVFESKNFSGWIFGNEKRKYWYQTLASGMGECHKENFYNPIMQNRNHIKYLKKILGEEFQMYSIIVFSDRCTFKNIEVTSNDVKIIKYHEVESTVLDIYEKVSENVLSDKDVIDIYNKLYKYTQIDEEVKKQHILNIQNNLSKKSLITEDENNMIQNTEFNNLKEMIYDDTVTDIQKANENDKHEQTEEINTKEELFCELNNVLCTKDISDNNRKNVNDEINENILQKEILENKSEIEYTEIEGSCNLNIKDELFDKNIEQSFKNNNCKHNKSDSVDNQLNKKIKTYSEEYMNKKCEIENTNEISKIENVEKEKDKCPICGAELILKTAKKGKNKGKEFLGCSRYPKCRYIRNI